MAIADDNRSVLEPLASTRLFDGEDLPRAYFLREVAGVVSLVHDEFPGDVDVSALETLGEIVLVRAGRTGETLEALIRLDAGLPALIDLAHGRVTVEVGGRDPELTRQAVVDVRARLHRPEPEDASVPFAFWWRGPRGGLVRHSVIDAPAWDDVRGNYARRARAAFTRLASLKPPPSGRMLVWRGPPGTGKTHAVRALARAWRSWCSVHVVLDPSQLFGADPSYLVDVLTRRDDDDHEEDRWRLVVLEDAGILATPDAGGGVALAPLLNLTDGLLGQGSRVLVLITTNEPLGRLHPALLRPGRCISDVEFGPLSRAEARDWLRRAGSDFEPRGQLTLAELYALCGQETDPPAAAPTAFGFSRALLE